MLGNACQINCGFYARVATTYYGNLLAFEQGAVAMRAKGNATGFVLRLARYAHFAPACTCGDDDVFGLQGCPTFKLHLC